MILRIWLIFIKTLMNKIQIRNIKYWSDLMIWLLICLATKKLQPVVTELLIKVRQINISFVFITQSYFVVPKGITLNSKHYFIMKIPNKRKFQQIAINYSSDTEFKDFLKLYKNCSEKRYSFSVNNTFFPTDNPLHFRHKRNVKL